MTLNIDKNKDALVAAWKEVMNEKDQTNWALFGYDGQSYDLNLISKGDGGLEELIDDFNSGKIMYALCRVKIKEKNVEKVVLINWQGEGAPLARKGTCANHVQQVKNFFKGVHVTMNARQDEDVEPDVVLEFVAKATAGDGVKMSAINDMNDIRGPVGTTYKKVNPKDDINSAAKDEFWRKEEQEEERRKRDEQNKLRKFSQNEVKILRRESEEYFNEVSKQEPQLGHGPRNTGSITNNVNGNNTGTHITSAAAVKASTPRKNTTSSSGDLVRARIKSFDQGTPNTPIEANSDSNATNGKPLETLSVFKRRQMFEGGIMNSTTSSTVKPNNAAVEEVKPPAVKSQTYKATNGNSANVVNNASVFAASDFTSAPVSEASVSPVPPPTAFANVEPKASDDNVNGYPKNDSVKGIAPYQHPSTPERNSTPEVQNVEHLEDSPSMPAIEILPEHGICARALYDYQAADESEITFDPGDIITNIEKIDEGWWEGLGPNQVYGLFPANYVELLN